MKHLIEDTIGALCVCIIFVGALYAPLLWV